MKTRILIVDDEPEFTSLTRAHLETAGYFEVQEENDELSAVSAARQFAPDIILLDVMMPQLEGSEVASLLRADRQLRHVPILFLTALVSEDDAPGGAYTSGGNTFLPKQLPLPDLIDVISSTVSASRRSPVPA